MKKILFFILMLYGIGLWGQVGLPLNTAIKFQISNPGSSGTNPNFTVSGFVSDDITRWDATSVAIGDSLYVLDGSELFVFVITDINSAAGSALNIDVQAIDGEPSLIPPGQAAIVRPTTTNGYPTYISTLRDDLRSLMLNRSFQLIDESVKDAKEIAFTTGTGVPNSTVATVDGYRLAKNNSGDGDLYKWDGSAWVIDEISSFTSGGALGDLEIVDNGTTFGVPILDIAPVQDVNAGNNDIQVTNLPGGEVQLKIAQQAASSGQVLKWNGTQWEPAADDNSGGGGGVTDGDKTDITITGTGTIYTIDPNTIDSTRLQTSSVQSTDIANGQIWKQDLASDVIDSTKISNRSISVFDIGQNGASTGQILKWNGNMWLPSTDGGSVPSLTNGRIFVGNVSNVATEQIMSGDAVISNTGVVTVSAALNNFQVTNWNLSSSAVQLNNLATNSSRHAIAPTADINLSGIAPGSTTGKILYLWNSSSTFSVTLLNQDAASSVGNRFDMGNNYILRPEKGVTLVHDGSAWRITGSFEQTDLAVANNTTTTLDVVSNTGADATIPAATNSLAGLQTAAGKTKESFITVTQAVDLDAIEAASHAAVTVSDNARLDFVLTGQNVTADLLQNGASTGQHMTWNGSAWAPATAVDNSATNEIQTITAGGAGPTSYTIDNSLGGGSVTLSEGANIDLTRSGNTITIAASGGSGASDLTITGASSPLTLNSSTGTDVTVTAGTGISLAGTTSNMTITNTGVITEVDGSTSNEVVTISDGTDSEAMGGQTLTIAATGGATVDYVPATNTLTINAGSSSGGDNWGSQVVTKGATLTGQGIVGNILDVATGGITANELATGAVVLNSGDITNVLPLANGGTNSTTAQTAINTLAGAVTAGSYLRGNGTNVVMNTIQASDVPTLNQNTTGSAASFTGVLAGDVTGTQSATVVGKINGVALSGLATGILKNTTTTGVPSIAIAADFPILNQNTTGNAATVTTNANLTGHVTSTGNATVLGSFTSANLSGALTNETGTGVAVFSADPAFTGVPTAPTAIAGTNTTQLATTAFVTAANATNANLTGPITSVGNATSVAAQTGTGSTFVMNTSPTLVTPVIGAATGTSLSVSGQLTSTVVTGTPPLVVSSTTLVPNLNVATAALATTVTTNANLTGMVTSVGNATTVVTNANLTGDVTSSGNATTIADNSIDGTDIAFGSDLLGDAYYYNGTDVVRLPGNITTTKQFLTQTGNGTVSAAPGWGVLVQGDIPAASGGDVTGLLSNLQIGSGVVGSAEVTDNSLVAGDLSVNVVSSVEGVDNDGGNIDIIGAGITVITSDNTANTITFTSTEVDGSVTNEGSLTVGAGGANDATIVSNTSGSSVVNIVGGTNVTITENTGTGTITIAAAGGGAGTDLAVTGTSSPLTLTSSTGTDVTVTAGTGISLTGTSGNITVNNTGIITEVDGSLSNEGSLTIVAGGVNDSQIQSNSSGSTNVTIAGGTTLAVSESGSTITLGVPTDGITATQIATDAVASAEINAGAVGTSEIADGTVANADLANMAAHTFKGNNTAIGAVPLDLTIAQMQAELGVATTNLTFGVTGSPVTLNSSDGSDVTFTQGGIVTLTGTSATNITISAAEVDGSLTNEAQTWTNSGTTSWTGTLGTAGGAGGGSTTIQGLGTVSISHSAGTISITGTEVDGSTTNEGIPGVAIGSGTSSVITSTTGGSTGVTINAAGILAITETAATNGGSITLTATEVDGSISNELQTIANTSDATSHTGTLSNSGGSIKLVEGANITLTTTGTGLDGIVTIAASGGGGVSGTNTHTTYFNGTTLSENTAINTNNTNVAIGGVLIASTKLAVVDSVASNHRMVVKNKRNAAGAESQIISEVAGTSSGDALYTVSNGTNFYTWGLDNDVTNKPFVMTEGANLGSNDFLRFDGVTDDVEFPTAFYGSKSRTITGSVTLTDADYSIFCNSAGNVTVTLPATITIGKTFQFYNINTGTVLISSGANNINGSASTSVSLDPASATLFPSISVRGVTSVYWATDGRSILPGEVDPSELAAGTAIGQSHSWNGTSWELQKDKRYAKTGGIVSNNTVALADITGLTFSVTANNVYSFKAIIQYQAGAVTTGSAWGINGPAGTVALTTRSGLTANTEDVRYQTAVNSNTPSTASPTTTALNIATIEGIVRPTANGNYVLRFASEVAGSAITVQGNSIIEFQQIN